MPRKSTSSIPPTDGEETAATGAQTTEQQLKAQADGVGVEDLLLPRSVTQRLAKSVLPPNTTIQKDALLAIQKAATVFVSYLSSHANDATLKRTLSPADVLAVIGDIEFESFRNRLERELGAHNDIQMGKRQIAKEKKAAASEGNTENDSGSSSKAAFGDLKDDEEATDRGSKRVKRDSYEHKKTVPIAAAAAAADDTEVEELDEDETEEMEDAEDEEGEDEEDDESEDDGDETQEAEDLDRVEDLDPQDRVEDNSDSDGDEDGPAAQLRSNMGLG